ncbi:hypothetical protein ACH4GK_40775 [Streptomyces rimosus]|nr:hypothetical protein [Streptomyces rimosus]
MDYVAGWREARDASTALVEALAAAGIDVASLKRRLTFNRTAPGRCP